MDSIIFVADTHLMAATPKFRKDICHEAQYRKMEWILAKCLEHKCPLCIAGDVFDKKDSPAWHVNKYLDLFLNSGVKVYVVFGNHDQYFHSPENNRTQLGTLVIAKAVELLSAPVDLGWCVLQGRSWGEAYPEPIPGRVNILAAHETVTAGEPPPWMPDAFSARKMIQAHPGFEYIITGDFHEPFQLKADGCQLINTGPMTRTDVTKVDYQPRCYLVRPDSWESLSIPIEQDVFDTDAIELEKSLKTSKMSKEQMEAFEQALAQSSEAKPTFRNNVSLLLAAVKDGEIKSLAKEILEDVS